MDSQCFIKDFKVTFSLNVLCFPFTIGKVKITVFHLLVACTFVFTYLWGYVIYNTLIKDNQVCSMKTISLKSDIKQICFRKIPNLWGLRRSPSFLS